MTETYNASATRTFEPGKAKVAISKFCSTKTITMTANRMMTARWNQRKDAALSSTKRPRGVDSALYTSGTAT